MRVLVVGNGPVPAGDILLHAASAADFIIAADGGTLALVRNGITPDLIIGDIDSLDNSIIDEFDLSDRIIGHPSDKDMTDTELAVMEAIEREAERILVTGVLNGRVDHFLANLSLMATYPGKVIAQALEGPVRLVNPENPLSLSLKSGTMVSLSVWGREARGVITSGLKYPLKNTDLEMSGRGVENVAEGDISVTVRSGMVFATIHSQSTSLVWGNTES